MQSEFDTRVTEYKQKEPLPDFIHHHLEEIQEKMKVNPIEILYQKVLDKQQEQDERELEEMGFQDPFKFYTLDEEEVKKLHLEHQFYKAHARHAKHHQGLLE